jgi:DNA repair exonuclease SbcCD ATPase subunit
MEIEQIRKELNHLLNSVVDHSTKYSDERPIPSLEISFVLTKINKMKENLVVLNYLLKEKEKSSKRLNDSEREIAKTKQNEEQKNNTEIEMSTSIQEKNNTAESIVQIPVLKLADALTLNDRYLYANQLFDKDMNAFNEMIKSIDECSSLDEAKDLHGSLGWDDENTHVISFNILVDRRFS